MAGNVARHKPRERRLDPARVAFPLPDYLQRILDRGKPDLEAPFKGITTDGTVAPGLFSLQKTGVSLQPVADAATAFLAALAPAQRAKGSFPVDAPEWRQWCNIHPFFMRHGLLLEELTDAQRRLALEVVRASLSTGGFELARDVMRLNEHVLELTGKDQEYGEWLYWMSLMGTPSPDKPWGWQLDGHHLIINCFILGDQMVMTPTFMGSEPVEAYSGKYKGTRVFQVEEAQGFALMSALAPEQRQKATIGTQLPPDVFGTAFRDNLQMSYEGIRYAELSRMQQELLVGLIGTYVGRIRPGHAEIRYAEVKDRLADTYFAWMGGCDDASPFYYRIHSPVVLIELDHQPGIALGSGEFTRDHLHTLVRTPNGNDYGKDLLRQHYAQFDHSTPTSPHLQGKASRP